MKRLGVVVLALIAAFAAPVRAACGAACEAPVRVEIDVPEPPCHTPSPAPAEPLDPEHCSHDHSVSVSPAARASVDAPTQQPMAFVAIPAAFVTSRVGGEHAPASAVPRGSPPLRNLPLRI